MTDPDLGELLSAHLDGELTDDEEARVADLLARDPSARAELEELRSVRSALRGLPAVEPPLPFAARVLRPGRRPRRSTAVLAAAAAVLVVLGLLGAVLAIGGGGDADPMVPPVGEFAARHGAMVELVSAGAEGPLPDMGDDFDPMSDDELSSSGMDDQVPPTLPAGLERMAAFHTGDGTMHVVYTAGSTAVSIYQQEGEVDWGALPATGQRLELGGTPAWLHTAEGPRGPEEIMVVQRGSTVYTVVAENAHDHMMVVVEGVALASA